MRRRPTGILALLVITSLVALAGGWTLMFYAAWTILFLFVAAYVLSVIGLRALYFERRARALRAEVGSYFDERIIVENRSWIPKLWLEIEDLGQHPEHTASFVVSLGPYGRFVRQMAWSSVWSRSGLSRYIVCRIGASKPVRSFEVTMRILSGSAGSRNRSSSFSSASRSRRQGAYTSSPLFTVMTMSEVSGGRNSSSAFL